jgi:GMP synthase-like glutamine amidotransferase
MGVYQTERYPWLRDEMALINDAMQRSLPVLGVCLGAQIVAAALGAKVERNPNGKEIGWHPIRLELAAKQDRLCCDLPQTMTPFHWHGDIFELPSGAVSLASSEKTPCQAFCHGDKTWGFQFHFEVTRDGVTAMAEAFAKDLDREKIAADAMIARAAEFTPARRSPELLNYMLACPGAAFSGFVIREGGQARGYFVLSRAGGQTRIADLWTSGEWPAAVSLAAREAARDRATCEVTAVASVEPLRRAIEANGFQGRGAAPVFLYDPKGLLATAPPLDVQLLDGDECYLNNPADPFWT